MILKNRRVFSITDCSLSMIMLTEIREGRGKKEREGNCIRMNAKSRFLGSGGLLPRTNGEREKR
jgi:hypothetical protein